MDEEVKKILVVDDEKLIREIVTRIAQKRGATVTALPHGNDTPKVMQNTVFDLAVVDLLMPETSGWDVIQMIRSDPKNKKIPIIILSGTKISAEEKAKLLETVNAVVNKTNFTLHGFESIVDSCSIV